MSEKEECDVCNKLVKDSDDGLMCEKCLTWKHRTCLSMTVKTYQSLSKSPHKWYCSECQGKMQKTRTQSDDTDKNILTEMKAMLRKEFGIFEDKIYKKYEMEMNDLRLSIEYMAEKFEAQQKLNEECLKQNKRITQENEELKERLKLLENKFNHYEQLEKQNNIVVTGIDVQENRTVREVVETLLKGMGVQIGQEEITDCYRVKTQTNVKPIIIKCKTHEIKKKILQRRKVVRSIYTKDCKFTGTNGQIFLNDELTKQNQNLFKAAREFKKQYNYKYAYCVNGPAYWGLMNPQWNMCSRGRRQSPVNVEPDKLLFDPYLRHIHIDKHKVSGTLHNTGQSLVFRVDKDTKQHVNISGGPLAYRYQFEEIYIHYGTDNQQGSEHHIQGYSFPAEIQFYGFNKELYHNMSEAQHKSQGIVAISLMVQIGDTPNGELRLITSVFNKVQYKGAATPVKHISLRDMLPKTELFMTYEGSTTHPGCWETTVWIIFNKPIYITKHELYQLRKLMQGSEEAPKAPLGNNARPIQPLHQRTIRTNINFKNVEINSCPSMHKEMYYRANKWSQNVKDYNPFHSLHSLQ